MLFKYSAQVRCWGNMLERYGSLASISPPRWESLGWHGALPRKTVVWSWAEHNTEYCLLSGSRSTGALGPQGAAPSMLLILLIIFNEILRINDGTSWIHTAPNRLINIYRKSVTFPVLWQIKELLLSTMWFYGAFNIGESYVFATLCIGGPICRDDIQNI